MAERLGLTGREPVKSPLDESGIAEDRPDPYAGNALSGDDVADASGSADAPAESTGGSTALAAPDVVDYAALDAEFERTWSATTAKETDAWIAALVSRAPGDTVLAAKAAEYRSSVVARRSAAASHDEDSQSSPDAFVGPRRYPDSFLKETDVSSESTLALAHSRAALGADNTHYALPPPAAGQQAILDGDDDANTFYCSALSTWTISAYGYNVTKPILGKDGRPFTYEEADGTRTLITPKMVIDGQAEAVWALSILNAAGEMNGGDAGKPPNLGPGFKGVDEEALFSGKADPTVSHLDDNVGVMGAPGALVLMQIGAVVAVGDQKPGDFAQLRRLGDSGAQDGTGHAWQVDRVKVIGSGWFQANNDGSPELVDADLPTTLEWRENVAFWIDEGTDPAFVGEHTFISETRVEANGGDSWRSPDLAGDSDGGVATTDPIGIGETKKSYKEVRIYYGRTRESLWTNFAPANGPGNAEDCNDDPAGATQVDGSDVSTSE